MSEITTTPALRIPPQDLEAEVCVIGSMMLAEPAIGIARAILAADDFYSPKHRIIYAGLLAMAEANTPIDLVTARDFFTTAGTLEALGGIDYLVAVVDGVPSTANVEYYARSVRDKAIKRRLIQIGQDMSRDAYESQDAAEAMLSTSQQALYALDHRLKALAGNEATLGDALHNVMATAEQTQLNPDSTDINGYQTGYRGIDDCIHRLHPGHLIVVGAATGAGKTTWATNVTTNVAFTGGTALYFSAEMTPEEMAQRVLQAEAGVWGTNIQSGHLTAQDWTALANAEGILRNLPVYIVGRACTLGEIALKTRETAARFKRPISLVVVDYIQIQRLPAARDLRERVGEFTRGLKQIAMDLHVPVMALSQFRRDPSQAGRCPTMHDLKESGSIENDSNAVILLHKPLPMIQDRDTAGKTYTEVWAQVAKCRSGPTTEWPQANPGPEDKGIRLKWYSGTTRFV